MAILWLVFITLAIVAAVLMVKLSNNVTIGNLGNVHQQTNVDLFKQRLAELEQERQRGLMTQQQYEGYQQQLQYQLLTEIEQRRDGFISNTDSKTNIVIALMLLLPLIAVVSYYFYFSNPEVSHWLKIRAKYQAMLEQTLAGKPMPDEAMQNVADFARVLVYYLQQHPDKERAWQLLGLIQLESGNAEGAEQSFAKAVSLKPSDIHLSLLYAQARIEANQGRFDQISLHLLKSVLQKNPKHQKALALLGFTAYGSDEYAMAIWAWEQLLSQGLTEKSRQILKASVIQAKKKLIMQQKRQAHAEMATQSKSETDSTNLSLKVTVQLKSELSAKLDDNATLFVFAKAVNGPALPLAVVKQAITMTSMPMTIELNDSLAMTPEMKLSNFAKVQVTARISKAGTVQAQSGDLQGVSETIVLAEQAKQSQPFVLTIDQILP